MTDVLDVLEQGLAGPMGRRRFLNFTGAVAGAAAFCQLRPDLAHATTPLSGYPFTLGVASGDPATNGAVLWTRLAPEIYEPDGGVPHRRLPVEWRVSKHLGMRRVVRKGVTLAVPQLAHSVHVQVSGLEPGREYFFQFMYRDELSPVGRTLTAPSRWHSVPSLAFASCQKWDDGYYSAYSSSGSSSRARSDWRRPAASSSSAAARLRCAASERCLASRASSWACSCSLSASERCCAASPRRRSASDRLARASTRRR
jgi:hypothetical protein